MGKVAEKLWEANSKLPANVKKGTDLIIRGALKWRQSSQRRGKEFVKNQRKKLRI